MEVRFEWDNVKNENNIQKHNISFPEACELLDSELDYLEIYDELHSIYEDRFIAIGPIRRGLIVVIWTERDEETVRVISARFATRREERLYQSYMEDQK